MSFETADTNHGGQRPVGWFSRRHQTREAQDAARVEYFANHASKKSKRA